MPAIRRDLLRSRVAEELSRRIVSGELAPAESLNEAALAADLGVSRTPLREALLGLDADGLVRAVANRGFVVAGLGARDVRETYPVRGVLEALALRLAGLPGAPARARLTALNDALREPDLSPRRRIDLDERFHVALTARCPNRRLMALLARLRRHCRRYELAYMGSEGNVQVSVEQHAGLLAHLEAGALEPACAALEANMLVSVEPLLAAIEQRGAEDGR